ncbi:OLC1v1000214C2 [Oldenlandia corymbosa var. corymbosa]|uniref:OLC1v1000214C2 n=1 Tax=Oldenlandia corymbosa var. corymbosa TaxID=529605 RepID=A0AAV1D5V8_OLDCO|nr:OLC1v1000214C2 [Oldenlandia corymbosa var. corymbosa]
MVEGGGGGGNTAAASAFAKTICSICYEDLKPIVEDLQSISICGHVFHELCLQQWFEYCTNGKKKNCPVCKQNCSKANVARLYFQSIGDPNDQNLTQKPIYSEENPEELQNEISRLEGKVSRLSSALDQQQKSYEASNAELLALKEQLKVEEAQKKEALNQNAASQRLIRLKSEELDRSTLECMRLQNRNLALAKELAALKLVSDLDLNEGEILKLACLGNEVNNKETVDVLKKSLMIRNKSYKELMNKCNMIGRGETRSLAELKKAQEKIKKLKERIQELESFVEVRDNEALRMLKPSRAATNSINAPTSSLLKHTKSVVSTYGDQNIAPSLAERNMTVEEDMDVSYSLLRKKRKVEPFGFTSKANPVEEIVTRKLSPDNQEKVSFLIDENVNVTEASTSALHPLSEKRAGDQERNTQVQNITPAAAGANPSVSEISDDEVMVIDVDKELSQSFKVNKEISSPVVSPPGNSCFAAGLLGPDGTKWHLGKWCKKANSKGQASMTTGLQGSNASSGNLIAVGADGRGGTIKVLRTLNQTSLVGFSIFILSIISSQNSLLLHMIGFGYLVLY